MTAHAASVVVVHQFVAVGAVFFSIEFRDQRPAFVDLMAAPTTLFGYRFGMYVVIEEYCWPL